LGWAQLPTGVNWLQIIGVGFLAGIGFTMSLFITNLAYVEADMINASKIGIVIGSLIAGTIGFVILKINSRNTENTARESVSSNSP
jgi:NhaA family Na+:H+ antiporter